MKARGKKPHTELNPDEVVALGAAVQAQILAQLDTGEAGAGAGSAAAADSALAEKLVGELLEPITSSR